MQSRKAQNAIEFLAMLSVLLLIFIALFGFIYTQYGQVLAKKETTTLSKALEDIRGEVRQALLAPDGYTRQFYIKDNSIASSKLSTYNISIRTTSEIYINDSRGYSQILFLKPDEYVYGSICKGQNEIVKSADYGMGVCCGSCGGSVPGVNYASSLECKTNTSSYWGACFSLSSSNNLTQLRVNCSLQMTGANFTMYNQTGNVLLFANLTSTNVTVRNLSISWVSMLFSGAKLASATIYNVTAVCFNSTNSYVQTSNFFIS